jgi:hypothetical protein
MFCTAFCTAIGLADFSTAGLLLFRRFTPFQNSNLGSIASQSSDSRHEFAAAMADGCVGTVEHRELGFGHTGACSSIENSDENPPS